MKTFIIDLYNFHFAKNIKVKKSDIMNWVGCYYAIFKTSNVELSSYQKDDRIIKYQDICKGKYNENQILNKLDFIKELLQPTLGYVIYLHQAYIIYVTLNKLDKESSHNIFVDFNLSRNFNQVKNDYISILVNEYNFNYDEAQNLNSHLFLCQSQNLISYNDCIKEAESIIKANLIFLPDNN